MSKSNLKISNTEYAFRKIADVTARTSIVLGVTLLPIVATYVVTFHGQEIADAIRNKIRKIKNRKKGPRN